MRKIILSLFILVLSIFTTACFNGTLKTQETVSFSNNASATVNAQEAPTETKEAETTPSNENATVPTDEGISEGVLAYMDPKIDMLLLVDSVDWVYTKELYEGEVYFYPKDENPTASYNGFAISSQDAGSSTVEQQWNSIKSGFETSIPGFEWNKEKDTEVGNYTGYRYHFSGDEFIGDYIFWETEAKIYICSFTSFPDDYENNFELLINSLKSFKTLDEMRGS